MAARIERCDTNGAAAHLGPQKAEDSDTTARQSAAHPNRSLASGRNNVAIAVGIQYEHFRRPDIAKHDGRVPYDVVGTLQLPIWSEACMRSETLLNHRERIIHV